MDLSEALLQVKRGNGILFTGAGFSYGAQNVLPGDASIPNAEQFAEKLGKEVQIDGKFQLPAIAQFYKKKKTSLELTRILFETFNVSSVQKYHITIASQPWRRVYTTNYDNCFEVSASKVGAAWTPITTDATPTPAKNRCVHINGYISSLTSDTLEKQIKLTHSSYSAEDFKQSKWSQQLRQDINSSKAIVFAGYSLYDLDISRILYQQPDLKDRTHFIVAKTESPVSISILEDYGTVHTIGVEDLAQLIENTPLPATQDSYELTWLRRYRSPLTSRKATDVEIIDLILRGTIDQSCTAWSLAEAKPDYVVRRNVINNIIDYVENENQWILIHSDLGNGKSIIKEQLSFLLEKFDYEVYWDTEFDIYKSDDAAQLAKNPNKKVIMLDAQADRLASIDVLRSIASPNTRYIIFVRSTLFQIGEKRYEDHLPDNFIEVDINRLDDSEVSLFTNLLESAGLWGDFSTLSTFQKENRIKVEYGRSIQKIILATFEESDIGRRLIKEAVEVIKDDAEIRNIVITCLIMNRLEVTPNPTTISELLYDTDVWKTARSQKFKRAGEFLRFENGNIRVRSSILSDVILRSAVSPKDLIIIIEQIVRELAGKSRKDVLHHVFTQLMRFPTLEGMITGPNKREIIIGFFQSIKDLPFTRDNADFWLHYAMARLSFGDFENATRYFSTAKNLARGNSKKITDVNNHFARLLLDSRIKSDDYSDHAKAFELAHEILIGQMNKDDNMYYPYRQAKKYVDFISSRKNNLTESDIKKFVAACQQVKSAIRNAVSRLKHNREVEDCEHQMDRAIEIASLPKGT